MWCTWTELSCSFPYLSFFEVIHPPCGFIFSFTFYAKLYLLWLSLWFTSVPTSAVFLTQNGCDVNSQSYSGNTALHGACGRGQVDTVRLLLKSGADSSVKNYHNDTAVMVANNKKVSEPGDPIII